MFEHFVTAQDPVYEHVLAELAAGHKATHWMWFIFPQIAGLGSSPMSRRYAIHTLEEARQYLAHPVVGQRLKECTTLVNQVGGKSAHAIFSHPDDLKFHSSMTLFANATDDNDLFRTALRKFFEGHEDGATAVRI